MVKVVLTKDQENANNRFLDFLVSDDNFFVIQGAAGTGKSFLIKHLLETFYAKYQSYCLLLQKEVQTFDITITATTNKAVSVVNDFLKELLDQRTNLAVCTIFSLLGLKVENDWKTGKTNLTFNNTAFNNNQRFLVQNGRTPLVFVDEASFIGEDLHQIIESVLQKGVNAKVVYIGDQYQLAPVGQSFSAMDSLNCQKVVLDEIVRNSGHILATGTQFRRTVETGKFQPIQYNNSDLIHVDGPTLQQMIEASFADPRWTPATSKVLAWTNERVQEYNKHIRQALHRPEMFEVGETVITNEFIKGNSSYSASVDSAVTITNINQVPITNYGVTGLLIELDHSYVGFMPLNYQHAKDAMKVLAKGKEWKKYFEIKENWLDLRAIYASTINKAQGSTYETVFIDLADIGKNWNAIDVARLLYVAITRSSKKVVCRGYLPNRYC